MKNIFFLPVLAVMVSCSSTVKFPVSDVIPAANFTVTKKTDKYDNIRVEVRGKNVASPERLNPPGNNYSIWIETKEHGVLNIGQLKVDNGEKVELEATTPFDFSAIFITVENEGNLHYPTGTEIARATV